MKLSEIRLSIIGLGYVGLPLAVEFGRKRPVVGFDINSRRIDELKSGHDFTLGTTAEELRGATHLVFTTDTNALRASNCYIVTVPTPVDAYKRPDLTPFIRASETVGEVLKKGDAVIYEPTVYPGATEEDCVPVLEKSSGLNLARWSNSVSTSTVFVHDVINDLTVSVLRWLTRESLRSREESCSPKAPVSAYIQSWGRRVKATGAGL